MSGGGKAHPSVFISYSHDSVEHRRRVRELADDLRGKGVDCDIDDYHHAPPEGWQIWMAQRLRESDFVLMVCTETYERRVTGQEPAGKGAGVSWEGRHITQAIYDQNGRNARYIPIVLAPGDVRHVPVFARHTTIFDVSSSEQYDRLVQMLHGVNLRGKPPLGPVPEFSIGATMSTSPALPPLSTGGIKVKREFTALDKDRYLRECFGLVVAKFEQDLKELRDGNAGVEVDFIRIDANRVQASVYLDGQEMGKCTMWLSGGGRGSSGGIYYAEGHHSTSNQFSEWLSVAANGTELGLSPLSAGFGGHDGRGHLRPDQAAERLFLRLISRLLG